MTMTTARWPLLALAALSAPAAAHGGGAHVQQALWRQWTFDAAVLIPLLIATGFYALGAGRLWRRAGVGHGIPVTRALAYGAGLIALVAALMSPLDAAADRLFSLHMTQHLLLILVAPPLLIIGAPDVALLWALPPRWRGAMGRFEQRLGRTLTGQTCGGKGPLVVVLLAVGVLWIWHVPRLYDMAVRHEALHWAEHASFLVSSLLFWAMVLRLRPGDHTGNGLRILYVFAMALQGSILGALITFASRPLYTTYAGIAPQGDLQPLVDQQIAGLLMWVPPAVLYVGVSAYLFTSWLHAVGARSTAYDRQRAARTAATTARSIRT